MRFVAMKDQAKLGLTTVSVGGHEAFCATYEGAIVTKLFDNEEGAIAAAKAMMNSLAESPILGVVGFIPDKSVGVHDRVCFAQVMRYAHEDYLVVGTEAGALEVIYETDNRDMQLDERDVTMGSRVYSVINHFARLLVQQQTRFGA